MGLCGGEPLWRAQMLDGVTVHHLSPPDPACALSHLSAEAVCAHSLSLPAAQTLRTSPGVQWVWGSQTACLVCEPCDFAWEGFGDAMWPREATTIHQQQSLFHIMGHCLILHLHNLGRERNLNRQGEFACLMFILHESRRMLSWGQQPEPLEVSQIVLNLVKNSCCQYLLTSFTGFWIRVWFSSPLLSCPLYQIHLPSKLIFSFSISLPTLCWSCSLAREWLRWGECWLAVEEWHRSGASCGGVCSSMCCKVCAAELQRGTSN